jgi:hypothetical protein
MKALSYLHLDTLGHKPTALGDQISKAGHHGKVVEQLAAQA